MTIFKPKSLKNIVVNKISMLDVKHQEKIQYFDKQYNETLPKYRDKLKKLETKLEGKSLEDKLDVEDQIKVLKKKIKKIKKDKKDYLLNNSKYIFDYFEQKKSIAEGDSKTTVLENFFYKNTNKVVHKKENKTESSLYKYLANLDETNLNINDFVVEMDICRKCNKGEMIPIDHEGLMVCNNCSNSVIFLIENEKPSYKEPPKEVCFYAYKRINHFREILAQFQAKETTQIPTDVLENIKLQIKKERLDYKQLTNTKAKDILKKLGYNKYYEHIPFIKDKLGIKPPIMNPELEERLCNLFIDIQIPYAKYCPDNRVNFLNYHYTIYKLCELLNQRQFLPYFPMLKDREKRMEQDNIWKQICNELDWQYIPTI